MQKIGEEHQDLLLVRVPVLDAPEQNRLFAVLVQGGQRDDLVAEHVALFWNRAHLDRGVDRIGLHACDEEDPVPRQLPEPHVIVIAAIDGQDRTRFQTQASRHFQFAIFAVGHYRERGQIAVVVQWKMQFDDAAVQAHQLVLETKLTATVRRRLGLTLSQQLHENRLVEFPGAIGVGISQG